MAIKIGDKEYTEEQLQAALKSQTELQTLQEQVAPALKLADRYRLSMEDLVSNAEGAFGQVIALQEAGLIDDKGQIVKSEPEPTPTPSPTPTPTFDKNSIEEIVDKALGEKIDKRFGELEKGLKTTTDYTQRLLREKMVERVQAKHPNLTEEDISMLTARAAAEKKDFWDVAEERSKAKEDGERTIIDNFAKEHNLDIEKLNKVKEMRSNEGAISSAIIEGRKISSKGGENTVTPLEATKAFFETADQLERS